MRPTDCRREHPGDVKRLSSCIERLAEGWILPTDLCPVCTGVFMEALAGAVGQLRWHPNYSQRAEETR